MASTKMTFTMPEELARRLLKRVPSRDRSRFVAEAITAKLEGRDQRLIHACEVANRDAGVLAIERDWERLADDADRVTEPWIDAPSR